MKGDLTTFGDFSEILLDQKKAQGGAGEIWTIRNHPDFVAKVYHEDVEQENYEHKVKMMLANKPAFEIYEEAGKRYPELTWPVSIIRENKQFIGYVMPKLDFATTSNLERFLHKKSRQIDGITNFAGHRFNVAYNLAYNLNKVHQAGHLVVDLKPQNILVERKNLYVSILDTDGFMIKCEGSQTYPAKQYTPNYVAPEFISKKPEEATVQQDLFALAVIVFQLANNGIHPFQAGMKRASKTIQEMVEKKYYAYGLNGSGRFIPSKFSEHTYWPNELRSAFDQAFGSKDRPSAEEWQKLLLKFTSPKFGVVGRCTENSDHIQYLGECSQCGVINHLVRSQNEKRNQRGKITSEKPKLRHGNTQKVSKTKTATSTSSKSRISNTPHVTKSVKDNLIRRAIFWTITTFVIVTVGLDVGLLDLSLGEYIEKRTETHPWWSIFYAISLYLFYYALWRGRPARDCPKCGSYAGALRFRDSEKHFVKWRHQTKSGRPDKRYKNNNQLFELTSIWECPHCDATIQFQHSLSENPNRYTPIDSKKVLP